MITAADLMLVPHIDTVRFQALRSIKMPGVSTDSRTIRAREVFIALRGETFDGHSFLGAALERGAACLVVDRKWYESTGRPAFQTPMLVVDDTTHALGHLAHLHREKFRIPVVAVAGSNGKTTTKDMIAAVCARRFATLKTEGNLNNQIGVPMTVLRLTPKHRVAVVEHGTNHPGELERLLKISQPTHGLVTTIGREHLEFFSTVEGVAAEEGTVFRHAAFGFVNRDEPLLVKHARKAKQTLGYGFAAARSDVRGKIVGKDPNGCMTLEVRSSRFKEPLRVQLGVPGMHNARNALAAAAVGIKLGVTKKDIKEALEKFTASSKRTEIVAAGGVTIVNDTYNANPDSVVAALAGLEEISNPGKKIVVLADMLELGTAGEQEHAKIGLEVANRGFEFLYTFGLLSRTTFEASKLAFAQHFDDKKALIDALSATLEPGDAVLVKGSRGMRMEEVVEALVNHLKQDSRVKNQDSRS